jgi:hypothetical protein
MTVSLILWYYLWVAPKVLQVILLGGMVRRGLHRQFPMFFLYTGLQVVQTGVLLAISWSHFGFGGEYFRAYSATRAVSAALRFGIIHELFSHFFRRYPLLIGTGRSVLRGATIALLLVAVGGAAFAPGNSSNFLFNVTYTLDRVATILQSGLLISLFVFSRYFVLSWRNQAFGIALGLGILASVELPMSVARLYGLVSSTVFDFVIMGTYHCCVLIWIFYLALPERRPRQTLNPPPEHNLDVWNRELERLLQR